ncbi:hypothetical protein GCWU000324_00579 [Kingella oralis ATCC 51147]|uniref:Uncharacterized protein n=1 Tax=Kingella oralis ATCC 51147 TaxID=629741 RepID=C4GI87_9NEIS|nr:hypothetical protein GCWU000324_00579 [Kingella oralis ATCC 51147]
MGEGSLKPIFRLPWQAISSRPKRKKPAFQSNFSLRQLALSPKHRYIARLPLRQPETRPGHPIHL